jgi:site-specific DNA recombinase
MLAIGYTRVSTSDQVDGISLDAQESKIIAYCQLKDLQLLEIKSDAGISAKNMNRPALKAILRLAQKKQIDAVVVYKLDRIFRSTVDALETTKLFDKWGVSLHSIEEALDSRSALGRFFFTLTAALAEMERRLIGERTKSALAHKRSKNEKTGGDVPFGYDLTPVGLLIKNDAEQKVIRLIRHLHRQGISLRGTCRELQQFGYQTKRGNLSWHPQTIAAILKRND